ncbi:hypothetical protein KBB96_07315 [Luteolibacter ambystomatis]|uniref:Uncharacterized protein n=2 Tax=Luteolibacter ambystomatis TaxID=2824561 RepID=A0A975J280_9BACT|nr:hypothetical protein [Luteolibacter ambystomatis]QUE52695.1 hypothetical protein KBB96_07315 [Luteolibacter ambystomatis]
MRFLLFLCGISVLALAGAAFKALNQNDAMGFMNGALALGGGLIICGFFATRWFWHGLFGGGILALLAFGRGLFNLPGLIKYFQGEQEHGPLPILEVAVTVICLFLLVGVIKTLHAERLRRMLEEGEETEEGKD